MTREEAIESLELLRIFDAPRLSEAVNMAISAMRQQIPVKPKDCEDKHYACPVCGNILMYKWMVYPEKLMPKGNGLPCCLKCLQAIDWSEEE